MQEYCKEERDRQRHSMQEYCKDERDRQRQSVIKEKKTDRQRHSVLKCYKEIKTGGDTLCSSVTKQDIAHTHTMWSSVTKKHRAHAVG